MSEPRRFQRKGPIVEAFRLGIDSMPDWFCTARSCGQITTRNRDGRLRGGPDEAWIRLDGGGTVLEAKFGDYIMRYDNGDILPCAAALFEKVCEPINSGHADA